MTFPMQTAYLGLDLAHPLVASASPLTGRVESLQRLEDAGAAAVVLPSLFEEDVVDAARLSHELHSRGVGVFGEATTYLPELGGPDALERAVDLVAQAKAALGIPVIASLNGVSNGGWLAYAQELVDAGADALELNVYFVAADAHDHGAAVESRLVELVAAVRDTVRVPLAVKLGPSFSALAHFAGELNDAGADGLVLFNRFVQPDIDLETLEVETAFPLSTSDDLRMPLRWIGILHGLLGCSLACSGGVHTAEDVVKAILAGADAVMTTSALLEHGPERLTALRDGAVAWFERNEYESVDQARGSVSRRAIPEPDVYERAQYVAALRRASRTLPA